jgi:redox-sensitive bicupin YhaK (pirin superfamily)
MEQGLPAAFNGFVYVLDGDVRIGDGQGVPLRAGQVGWLDRPAQKGDSALILTAGTAGARVALYAGEPQHVPIVTHGPFVGGSRADLMRMSREWMDGRFPRMSELVRAAKAKS